MTGAILFLFFNVGVVAGFALATIFNASAEGPAHG